MSETFNAIELAEAADNLTVRYPPGQRIGSAVLFSLGVLALVLLHCLLFGQKPTLFSAGWVFIPICLFGDAAALMYIVGSGTFRAPLTIAADGNVRQGLRAWRFPGPLTAISVKISGKAPRFLLDLKYNQASIRLPGTSTEGGTIGLASRINNWAQTRMTGIPAPLGAASKVYWAASQMFAYSAFVACAAAFFETSFGNNNYLNPHAKAGIWSVYGASAFAALALAAALARWIWLARCEITAGAALWTMDILATILMIAGGTAIAGHDAQVLDLAFRPALEETVNEPLRLTAMTHGKGCHRYLLLAEPELERTIKYCDYHAENYWIGATGVSVRQASNALGVRVLATNRIDATADTGP
jgi:hypothetical protein